MGEIYQQLLGEFYRAYQFFNQHFVNGELPANIVTIVPLGKKNLGSFNPRRWAVCDGSLMSAIYIGAEGLKRGCDENLATLLHEMVHAYNDIQGIDDCSKSQYHNEFFAETAMKFGLGAEKGQKGYAQTFLTNDGKKAIEQLNPNRDLWKIFLPTKEEEPKKKTAIIVSKETKAKVQQLSKHMKCSMEDVVLKSIKNLAIQLDFDFDDDQCELPITTHSTTEIGIFH